MFTTANEFTSIEKSSDVSALDVFIMAAKFSDDNVDVDNVDANNRAENDVATSDETCSVGIIDIGTVDMKMVHVPAGVVVSETFDIVDGKISKDVARVDDIETSNNIVVEDISTLEGVLIEGVGNISMLGAVDEGTTDVIVEDVKKEVTDNDMLVEAGVNEILNIA